MSGIHRKGGDTTDMAAPLCRFENIRLDPGLCMYSVVLMHTKIHS